MFNLFYLSKKREKIKTTLLSINTEDDLKYNLI